MSKIVRLLISTATLLAIALMLLGAGGEAVGQKDKKPKFVLPQVKKDLPREDPNKKSAPATALPGESLNGIVTEVHAKNRTFVLNNKTLKIGDGCVSRLYGESSFTKFGLKIGDSVSVYHDPAGTARYILFREGKTRDTLSHGKFMDFNTNTGIVRIAWSNQHIPFAFGNASVHVNGAPSNITAIKTNEPVAFTWYINAGVRTMTDLMVDRRYQLPDAPAK